MSRDYKSSSINNALNTDHNLRAGKAHWMGLIASIAILSSIFFLSTDNAKATRSEALGITQDGDITQDIGVAHDVGVSQDTEIKALATKKPTETTSVSNEKVIVKTATPISSVATTSRITLPLAIPHGGKNGDANEKSIVSLSKNVEIQALPKRPEPNIDWQTTTVKSGDNLALIFARQGLSPQQLDRVMRADKSTASLKRLLPGQQFTFHIDDGQLQQLEYKIDALNTLNIRRNTHNKFVVATDTR